MNKNVHNEIFTNFIIKLNDETAFFNENNGLLNKKGFST